MADFDLVCKLESVQSLVDALICVRWKKQQEAIIEISEHGLIVIAQELNCLQAKAYFRKELFAEYEFRADTRIRFGISLSLLIDTLVAFVSATPATSAIALTPSAAVLRYPGPDMELLLKMSDRMHTCMGAEIRTLLPSGGGLGDFALDDGGGSADAAPTSFALRSAVLKEVIEDLEWPGSSVQLTVTPQPPAVVFTARGHGDLQIELFYSPTNNLFIDFRCSRPVSYWYKYKFLSAITANIPPGAVKDNRGSKLTVDRNGLLRVQHIVNMRHAAGDPRNPGAATSGAYQSRNTGGAAGFSQHAYPSQDVGGSRQGTGVQGGGRTWYVEFYVAPSEDVEEEEQEE